MVAARGHGAWAGDELMDHCSLHPRPPTHSRRPVVVVDVRGRRVGDVLKDRRRNGAEVASARVQVGRLHAARCLVETVRPPAVEHDGDEGRVARRRRARVLTGGVHVRVVGRRVPAALVLRGAV